MDLERLCIGERLTDAQWPGLPLGRFAPPGHEEALPVAAFQDTVFLWRDGASAATVQSRRGTQHYERGLGVVDLMALDEEASVRHDRPESPGECLLVAVPAEWREAMDPDARRGGPRALESRFDLHDGRLFMLGQALERQFLDGQSRGALYTQSLSSEIVAQVNEACGGMATAPRRTTQRLEGRHRARLLRFIEDHLAADICLDELARVVGLSRQQLVRVFKATFGLSPYQYVIHRRVVRARQLLRDTRLELVEIAMACGFSGQPHFTEAFTRRMGVSPGRWRAAQR